MRTSAGNFSGIQSLHISGSSLASLELQRGQAGTYAEMSPWGSLRIYTRIFPLFQFKSVRPPSLPPALPPPLPSLAFPSPFTSLPNSVEETITPKSVPPH